MKQIRLLAGFVLVLALCVPAHAGQDYTWGVGLTIDYSIRDLEYGEVTGNLVNPVAVNEYAHLYSFEETLQEAYLTGTWRPNENFTLAALLGFCESQYKAVYSGTKANFATYEFSRGFSDLVYGLNLDYVGSITDRWSWGLGAKGRLANYRGGDLSLPLAANVSRRDSQVKRWSVDLFPRVIYALNQNVDFFAGPSFTFVRAELDFIDYTPVGNAQWTVKMEEDSPVGIRGGIQAFLGSRLLGQLAVNGISATGATASLSYLW